MKNKPCVLLAEDDADDIFLVRRAVRCARLSWRVNAVRDGEQAIEYLRGKPPYDNRAEYPMPELLLLDLKMPKLNGFDVLAWLRGRPDLGKIRIVVLSSSPMESDLRMAFKLGAREFLTKPQSFDDLVGMMNKVDERWHKVTEEVGAFEREFVMARDKATSWCDETCGLQQTEPSSE